MHIKSARTLFEIILEIVAGEGGEDSKLFASDLAGLYQRYASLLGITARQIDGESGKIVLKFIGKGVTKAFENEPGKHIIQRVSPTERNGRKHTSVVTVAVLSLPPEHTLEPLNSQDLEIIAQTGKQKAGGRNANCVNSAIRMKHKPTGLSVFINGRDQGQNKKEALRILTAKVNDLKNNQAKHSYQNDKKQQMLGGNDRIGGRGTKVRTYNMLKSRIVDHRLGVKTHNVKEVMKGNLGILFSGEKSSD